ncbi:CCD60 protein, partial [Bucco capensis]|nr:CCD60 protein [Bucco capensis]
RHHLNSVKQGGEYFHILHQESLERKNPLKADQEAQGMRWRTEFQPPKYCSDAEDSEEEISICSLTEDLRKSGKRKKIKLCAFTPVHSSVLIPNPPGTKSEHLFRQLCAIHWLLESLTLGSCSLMHSILTCWNPREPGGCKKTGKEMEEEKIARNMWKLFNKSTKKFISKAQYRILSKKMNRTSTPSISRCSSLSSIHGQTPWGSEISTVLCSEDSVKINAASSDVMSESAQAKEKRPLFPSLQKIIQLTHETMPKDVHKQESMLQKIAQQSVLSVVQNSGVNKPFIKDEEMKQRPERQSFLCCFGCSCHVSSFIKSKSNLCADMRQKFTAVHEEAAYCLHDTLVSLERMQEERCCQKYQAVKQLTSFRRDMETMRELSLRAEREHDEDGLNWFPVLLARLPESVKSDHYIQKILKKLERYSKTPDLKIHPDTFLKVLGDLQVWELCCPEIAAAVEFVRESIVQMPEEDFNKWFQPRVAPTAAQP